MYTSDFFDISNSSLLGSLSRILNDNDLIAKKLLICYRIDEARGC